MKSVVTSIAFVALSFAGAQADTTQVGPNIYRVKGGGDFSLSNASAASYLFSWSDGGGTFNDIADPTLILRSGSTYTFSRTTSGHPFIITDDTLPVTGSDGSFTRTTTSGTAMDNATLDPLDDFTADPAPTSDFISWTPETTDTGSYWYTCRITSHTAMTGAITVENDGVPVRAGSWSAIKALFGD